jgi:hypothetical protein
MLWQDEMQNNLQQEQQTKAQKWTSHMSDVDISLT